MDSLFYALKNNGFTEIFIKFDQHQVERYVSEARHPIITKLFISRYPLQLVKDELIMVLNPEKILVDHRCDDSVYFAFQGHHGNDKGVTTDTEDSQKGSREIIISKQKRHGEGLVYPYSCMAQTPRWLLGKKDYRKRRIREGGGA